MLVVWSAFIAETAFSLPYFRGKRRGRLFSAQLALSLLVSSVFIASLSARAESEKGWTLLRGPQGQILLAQKEEEVPPGPLPVQYAGIAVRAVSEIGSLLGLDGDSVAVPSSIKIWGGKGYVHFDQFVRVGTQMIPVLYAEMDIGIKAAPDGSVSVKGWFLPSSMMPSDMMTPKVSAEESVGIALQAAEGDISRFGSLEAYPANLMIIPPQYLTDKAKGVLSWEVGVRAGGGGEDSPSVKKYYYVDAETGVVVKRVSTLRADNKKIKDCSGYPNTSTCRLDAEWGAENRVNPPDNPPPPGGDPYTIPPYPPGRGPHPPPPPGYGYPDWTGSLDVDFLFHYLGSLNQYYLNVHGINGMNRMGGLCDGSPSSNHVTYTRAYAYLDAAYGWLSLCPYSFYDSEEPRVYFCWGTAVLDVVGHELTHGLVGWTYLDGQGKPIGMVYQGQSGAVEEAMCDIMAEVHEEYYTGLNEDWIFGATARGGPYRNLKDPGALIDSFINPPLPYPDRFGSSNFYCGSQDDYGVHHNATVPGHGAQLAVQGGDFNNCHINGIGSEKVAKIWMRALTAPAPDGFSRSETFNQAYVTLRNACQSLAQANNWPESDCRNFENALKAVELNQPGYCTAPSGPTLCEDCEDTDGGINLNVRGTVTYRGEMYQDYCESSTKVHEYYCVNGTLQEQGQLSCPPNHKCVSGRCTQALRVVKAMALL